MIRTVSSTSIDDLSRTSGSWLDQHASLVQLRPLVLNALKVYLFKCIIKDGLMF